jgi:hypothetical protein
MHKKFSLLPNKASEKSYLFFNNVVLQWDLWISSILLPPRAFTSLLWWQHKIGHFEAAQMMFNLFSYSTNSCLFLLCRKEPHVNYHIYSTFATLYSKPFESFEVLQKLPRVGLKIISLASLIIRDLSASCRSTSISNSFSVCVIKRLVS